MAYVYTFSFLIIILALEPWLATSNNFSSIFPPIFGDVCQRTECGQGTCKPSNDSTFGFACECEVGWKQARPDHEDDFRFLPCVIPNCTFNFSCAEAPSPAPEREKRANESIFDPCYWTDCGHGTCNKTSPFTHKCDCHEGYYNILNVTSLPCFKECALGTDCARLGIGMTNKSTASSPTSAEDSQNQATSIAAGYLKWSVFMMISLTLFLWK